MKKLHSMIMIYFISMFLFSSCIQTNSADDPIYFVSSSVSSLEKSMENESTQTQETITKFEPTYDHYDIGFAGVDTKEVSHQYGNNSYYAFMDSMQRIPMNIGYGMPLGFCYNNDSNTLYYVNYEKDNFFYSYHDGISTLLIDRYVNYPNYWDGSVYFLSNENLDELYQVRDHVQGKLYRYGLEDGQIELILDQYIWDLRICDGYFYFSNSRAYDETGQERPLLHYRMQIGEQQPEETDFLPFFYGEYQLQFIQNPLDNWDGALALTNGTQSIPLVGNSDRNFNRFYCIENGRLWITQTMPNTTQLLISIALDTGDISEYPLITQKRDRYESDTYGLQSFTILDNTIYTISNDMLCYYDTDKMALIPLPEIIVTNGAINYREMKGLYSDGKSLYCYNAAERFIYKTTPLEDGTYLQESIGEYVPYAGEDDQKLIIVDDWYHE